MIRSSKVEEKQNKNLILLQYDDKDPKFKFDTKKAIGTLKR